MPPKKKLRLEGGEAAVGEDAAPEEDEGKAEPEAALVEEEDAPADSRPKLKEAVKFNVADTTLNVLQGPSNLLMCLSEPAVQYFHAGARANVGLKSGRYVFEARILEFTNPVDPVGTFQRTALGPKHMLRIGLSTAGSLPLLGSSEESVCFDSDGQFLFDGSKQQVSQKFGHGCTIAFVVNLDAKSRHANTVSLFKDGVRVSKPQPLPEQLKGQVLYPTVSYKNVTVHLNFGPELDTALPFKCRTVGEAAAADAQVAVHKEPKDGRYDVVFPVCLPDEGTFEWLDYFSARNPQYTELSDRKIIEWALRSGMQRQKAVVACLDKPDTSLGIREVDDGSVGRLLLAAAATQRRHLVVMEVKSNLLKKDRTELAKNFRLPHFRRLAWVLLGEPEEGFKKHVVAKTLKDKQAAALKAWEGRQAERLKERQAREQQRKLEAARRRAEKIRKLAEEKKAKEEAEKVAKGEGDSAGDTEMKDGAEEAKAEAKELAAEAEKEPENDEEMDVEEPQEPEEPQPVVELTDDEKHEWFRKGTQIPDISASMLSNNFTNFCFPEEAEGFDEVDYRWLGEAQCKNHLRQWILDRKVTTRVESLEPSDYFYDKYNKWQQDLQVWTARHLEFKDPQKRATLLSTKRAATAKANDDARQRKTEAERKRSKDGKIRDKDEQEQQVEAMKALEDELDRQDIDVFAVEDVNDIGHGEPLYFNFEFEDWALLTLRFEIHLLCHAFQHDCNDKERPAFPPEHLNFYYSKYFKKSLIFRSFGVEKIEEVLELVKDTIAVVGKVVEPQITGDLEYNDIFIKLCEEARRERQRRIDLGDESAKLNISAIATPPPGLGAKAKSQAGMDKGMKGMGKMGSMPKVQMPPAPVMGVVPPTGGASPKVQMPPAAMTKTGVTPPAGWGGESGWSKGGDGGWSEGSWSGKGDWGKGKGGYGKADWGKGKGGKGKGKVYSKGYW